MREISRCLDVSIFFPLCWVLLSLKNDPKSLALFITYKTINYSDKKKNLTHTVKLLFFWNCLNMRCISFPLRLPGFPPTFVCSEVVSSGRLNQKWRAMTWAILPELISCMAAAWQTYCLIVLKYDLWALWRGRATSKCEERHVITTHIHANKYRGHHGKVSVCVLCVCVFVEVNYLPCWHRRGRSVHVF